MTHPIRSIFALTILAIVLVACGTTIGAPTSEVPEPSELATPSVKPSVQPSVQPSVEPSVAPSVAPEPSEPAQEEREVAGTITQAEMAFSGPGGTIAEALAHGNTGNEIPTLVNGVIFLDTDGRIYLATELTDEATPSFGGPMLEVLNMDNDGPSWDMAYAEQNSVKEVNGIRFREGAQVLGYLEVK
jgi:hypothetical protein